MAAFTLFDLTYRVARELGIVFEGTATGGSQTTVIDTTYLLNRFEDDVFNAGTVWILYDAGGAAAAPQGEMARITDFVKTTGVVTCGTLTAAVASGDRYAIADDMYTKDVIIQAINQVLGEIPIPAIDDTTVETDTDITEYTLATTMLDQNIEVWINTNDETDNNYWIRTYDWYIQDAVTGTGKELIFRNQPPEPYHVRIKYWTPHTPLYATSDKLYESVDINRVVLGAAYRLLLWKKAQMPSAEAALDQRISELYARMEAARWKSPARKDYIKLNTYGYTDSEETY